LINDEKGLKGERSMKQWVMSSILMVASLISVASCSDEKEVNGIKEGVEVDAKLSIGATAFEKIQTKVADDYISDLYVMVFDESGDLLTHQYYSGLAGLSGDITISTTSGKRYIYGIANLSTSNLSVDASTLNNISSVDGLKSVLISLSNNTVGNADGKYLMSGFWCEKTTDETAETCLININGAVTSLTGATGTLKLKRLQSKVTFNVFYSGNATSYVITEVNLRKIPGTSRLTEDGTSAVVSSGYFNVDKLATNAGNKSFTFYMLENKQVAKGTPSTYSDRENVSNGSWVYAPDNSTYVEIKGHYVGTADRYTNGVVSGSSRVDANVTYYIHLGYVDDNLSDFNSLRNKDYTYNITVTGVNSLVAEVEVSGDKYDRGDGDIYYADGENVITLDAHYSQFVMGFTYEQLGKEGLDFSVLVKSNNTSGFQNADHDWLSFVENPNGVTKVVSYPGSTSSKLLNTDEFLAALKDFKNDVSNEGKTIYFTCYVNEYYPIGTDSNWKKYVNQDHRYAQIICDTKSGNGSNLIDAAYVIRQHPILSFYNLDNVNAAWGIEWENETTNTLSVGGQTIEIGLPYGTPAGAIGSSNTDGRENMIEELGNSPYWYSNSSVPSSELAYRSYSSALQKAYAACMQRNRDENGNGKIDDNEIKWYLPALNQYLDMSIGMNILPQDVQLYSNNDYNTTFNENNHTYWMFMHFVSNTKKEIFWGEEGGPYSTFDGSGDGQISYYYSVPNGERQFRCIRNVGSINNFDDFVSYSGNVVNLSKVNPQALRLDYLKKGELQKHDERSIYSRPYTKFQIAKNTCGTSTALGKFVGWGKGSYALSDKKGNYCTSNAYGKLNAGGSAGSLIKVGKGKGVYDYWWTFNGRYGYTNNSVAYSMADLNGYYISYNNATEGFGTWNTGGTANTYYYVGSGNGFYELDGYTLSGTNGSYGWETVNNFANANGSSICSYYYENSDKSDVGTWRLPNMRELLIIVNKANYTSQSIMSRTYYSFYGTGYLSPGNSVSREGYAYNRSVVYLIDPADASFNIRCVRDIQ